ncbi:MAG: hypothetical protein ABI625_26055 [bacterium]
MIGDKQVRDIKPLIASEMAAERQWVQAHPGATKAIIGALVLAVLALALFGWSQKPKPLISVETRALQDSLKRTQFADSSLRDSLRTVGTIASASAAALNARSNVQTVSAVRSGTRADAATMAAARRLIAVTDTTAQLWKAAADLRKIENDSLRLALVTKDSAFRAASVAANNFRLAAEAADARLVVVQAVNDSLITAVDKAERGCRFLHYIPCPTRARAGIVGVVVGAAAVKTVQIILSH